MFVSGCSLLQDGAVQLTIGHHQLQGKQMPLKKPFAMLERTATAPQGIAEYRVGAGRCLLASASFRQLLLLRTAGCRHYYIQAAFQDPPVCTHFQASEVRSWGKTPLHVQKQTKHSR
jgi:hypothetical protein